MASFLKTDLAKREPLFCEHWPNAADGVKESPENYKEVFQSQTSRVIKLFIGAYKAENPHTNTFKSVIFVDQPANLTTTLVGERGDHKPISKYDLLKNSSPKQNIKKLDSTLPGISYMKDKAFHFTANKGSSDYLATQIETKNPTGAYELEKKEIGKERLSLYSASHETYLIGSKQTSLKIQTSENGFLESLPPLKNLEGRSPIWHLSPCCTYFLEAVEGPETVYKLKIPVGLSKI